MKKLAIFVEGQTEQLFVSRLLTEIAGEKNINIDPRKAINKKGQRSLIKLNASKPDQNRQYYILIVDCGGEYFVSSNIKDSCEKMSKSNYEQILGLRDVYPKKHADIPKLKRYIMYGIPTRFISIKIILAVMEIESWFLADSNHFINIHPNLKVTRINSFLNFDIINDNVENRHHPAKDLDDIYHLENLAYTKRHSNTLRTVNSLDYLSIYLSLINRIHSLNEFIKQIDSFLDS